MKGANAGPSTRAISLAVVWAQFGPYHFARLAALRKLARPGEVHGIEFADGTSTYSWRRSAASGEAITLEPGSLAEDLPFSKLFVQARRKLSELRVRVCLLPSYWPKQSLAALLAAKSLRIRTVMMNESHAGTARAAGPASWAKRGLIRLFDAALVGGTPHKRYFTSLGLAQGRIFTGYDAIDNDRFQEQTNEVRNHEVEVRNRFLLPERYFLSLGRLVRKKNLATLVRAFRQFLDASGFNRTHLVLVGSGEEEDRLKGLCAELRLPVYDKEAAGARPAEDATLGSSVTRVIPGVHFYGFRQIVENPAFYALADGFILPSLHEEWGLVVNEAMASGLPVVVSQTAGCAEDLLEPGDPTRKLSGEAIAALAQSGLAASIRQNGFVFEPKQGEQLARILLLLESDSQLRSVMGQHSRRIIARFSCENFARNAWLAAQAALGTKWSSQDVPERAAPEAPGFQA